MAAAKVTARERGLGFRLMFQDEARFGRMSLPYSAWAPKPIRPVVELALVREFSYVYCAASPSDGKTVWALADKMNTEEMGNHLLAVSQQFPDERKRSGCAYSAKNPQLVDCGCDWGADYS